MVQPLWWSVLSFYGHPGWLRSARDLICCMAAKGKESKLESGEIEVIATKPPKNVGNREQFQRMNYLYQLSMFCSKDEALSRFYAQNMDAVSKKTNAKLLPDLKRTVCKKCFRLAVIGQEFLMVKKRGKQCFQIKCKCGKKKTFPVGANKNYKNYYERDGNLINLPK